MKIRTYADLEKMENLYGDNWPDYLSMQNVLRTGWIIQNENRSIPDGLDVAATCGTAYCTNPRHLRLVPDVTTNVAN